MRQKLITLANSGAVFAGLLALWQLVLWVFRVPSYMLPSPWAVARAVEARLPSLGTSFAITAEEALGGLLASVVAGVAIALVFAQSRWVRRMFYPYTLLLQTVPIVAIAPLILMWVGAGTAAVTLIAFIMPSPRCSWGFASPAAFRSLAPLPGNYMPGPAVWGKVDSAIRSCMLPLNCKPTIFLPW
jgi:ABC-type nitrate/sulfonate/bicarbonate transport system permease component